MTTAAVTDHASTLASELSAAVPTTSLRIEVLDENRAPVETSSGPADLYLRLHVVDGPGQQVVDLLLADASGPRIVAAGVPVDELSRRLVRLVKTYQVERCGRDTFRTWAAGLSVQDLRSRLGLPATVTV